ncbi:MarR family transcriptional regulator [Streptomyces sp. N2-109]|uniref:MarR family transcriptional regulator n=1 Tax=Streptomyces gossypii TaxID=2883101 RepID=A0ABT2JQT9_9ACTN|nr:MarR family transcriptional regulator [Streptomyces gossypii]MCT2590073.1 MarR family transcriptional regulator [Streptomyces gossypii]
MHEGARTADTNRTANLLGATALAVTDKALAGITGAAAVSTSGAAALVVLSAAPGLSVTELGRRVGLSQSAAARMVDSLEAERLVDRRSGVGRWVSVTATEAGLRTAHEVLAARGAPLAEAVAVLDEQEQAALGALLGKLLTGIYQQVGSAERVCRLCDRGACVRGAVCPVGQAERHAKEKSAREAAAPESEPRESG